MNNVIFYIQNAYNQNGSLHEWWPNGWPLFEDNTFSFFAKDCQTFNKDMFPDGASENGLIQWVKQMRGRQIISLFNSPYGNLKDLNYTCKSREDLLPTDKYYYPFNLVGSGMLRYDYFKLFGLNIDSRVLDDCRSNKAKILVHELNEGHGMNTREVKEFLVRQSEVLNIPLNSFAFLDSNYLTPILQESYGTKGFSFFDWENHSRTLNDFSNIPFTEQESQRFEEIVSKQDKKYHFVSLNRRSRTHRVRLVTHILNRWRDKCLFSCDTFSICDTRCFEDSTVGCCCSVDDLIHSGYLTKEMYDSFPYTLDVDMSVNDTMVNTQLLEQAYINITTETMFYEKQTQFFSEKVFKPIIYMQPFILVGPYNSLHLLKEMGYQTFHPFINESYDNELNPTIRMEMILEEINRLSKFSNDEMKELVYNCKHILLYNLLNLKFRRNNMVKEKKFLEELHTWSETW